MDALVALALIASFWAMGFILFFALKQFYSETKTLFLTPMLDHRLFLKIVSVIIEHKTSPAAKDISDDLHEENLNDIQSE